MKTMNSFNEFINFEISHSHTLSVELGEKKMIHIPHTNTHERHVHRISYMYIFCILYTQSTKNI